MVDRKPRGTRKAGTLSRKPSQIRNRLRRETDKFEEDLAMLAEETDYKPVSEWTLEELADGKPRNPDGTKRVGKRPRWITPKIHAEIRRRLLEDGFSRLAENLVPAIRTLADMLNDETYDMEGKPIVDAKTKVDIAKFIIEQVLGKARQRIDLGATASFRDFLAGALVTPDGKPAHPIVEGTIVSDDDEADEEYDD
jgi:hypothetical protein